MANTTVAGMVLGDWRLETGQVLGTAALSNLLFADSSNGRSGCKVTVVCHVFALSALKDAKFDRQNTVIPCDSCPERGKHTGKPMNTQYCTAAITARLRKFASILLSWALLTLMYMHTCRFHYWDRRPPQRIGSLARANCPMRDCHSTHARYIADLLTDAGTAQ